MLEKLREALRKRREEKAQDELDRREGGSRNPRDLSPDELGDFNENVRSGPVIGLGGGPGP